MTKLSDEIIQEIKEEFPEVKCDYVLLNKMDENTVCLQISGKQHDIDLVNKVKMQRMIPMFCKFAGQMQCLVSHKGWYRYLFFKE